MGYSKDIYRLAQQELDRRRDKAQRTAELRRAELEEALPRLGEIQREMSLTGLEAVRASIGSTGDISRTLENLRNKNLTLQKERAKLLSQADLPADFLEVHYTCPKCQDTGYVVNQRCACLDQLLRRMAYQKVSESGGLGECRFDNFLLSYYTDTPNAEGKVPSRVMAAILTSCRDYADTFHLHAESLLFRGHTGLGKTHLSLAIAYEVVEKGYGVYYASCQRLLDKLQAQQFGRDKGDSTDYQQMVLDCDLLILDDLGAEFSTNFTVAALQNIINARLTDNRPTLISTNLDTKLLGERYGERVVSRLLCAYRAFTFFGDDIRMRKRMERG